MVEPHQSAQPSPVTLGSNRKAVNIIAMGSSRNDFFTAQLVENRPDILKDAEIWTINYMGAVIRCNRIIHIDPVHAYLGIPTVKDMCDNALKDNIPFYTSHPHPHYPNHVVYPMDRVVAWGGISYFNTSVSYAIALAMAEGYNEIGLFGCDFSYPDVHLAESGRACCEFWMGLGSERGIKFSIGQHSTLMDMHCGQHPYGWFQHPLAPPVNGGKLMNTTEILAHIERVRNPTPQVNIVELKIASPAQVESQSAFQNNALAGQFIPANQQAWDNHTQNQAPLGHVGPQYHQLSGLQAVPGAKPNGSLLSQ